MIFRLLLKESLDPRNLRGPSGATVILLGSDPAIDRYWWPDLRPCLVDKSRGDPPCRVLPMGIWYLAAELKYHCIPPDSHTDSQIVPNSIC